MDFVCAEINDIKGKVNHFETRLNTEEKMGFCEQRLTDLERYSRRWNLRLQGVPEKEREDVRAETIRICEATFAERGHSLADKIDTVHRIGRRLQNSSRPRPIIIQFSSRVARDGSWKAARTSEFLLPINFVSRRISSRLIGKEDGCSGPLLKRLARRGRGLTSWEPVPSLMDLKYFHLSTVKLFDLSG